MATITLTLATPTVGSAWVVEFTADSSTPIKSITGFSIISTTPDLGSLFSVSSVDGYDGSGVQYVTWRSTDPPGQHPSSGMSMDIWNQQFYENIITYNSNLGMTWTEMLTGNGSGGSTYALNTQKWSLVYDYGTYYAPLYSKGGTLTVSVD
jgi:hypothetical protein